MKLPPNYPPHVIVVDVRFHYKNPVQWLRLTHYITSRTLKPLQYSKGLKSKEEERLNCFVRRIRQLSQIRDIYSPAGVAQYVIMSRILFDDINLNRIVKNSKIQNLFIDILKQMSADYDNFTSMFEHLFVFLFFVFVLLQCSLYTTLFVLNRSNIPTIISNIFNDCIGKYILSYK